MENKEVSWECPYGICNCCENLNGWCTVQYEEDLDCDYGLNDYDE